DIDAVRLGQTGQDVTGDPHLVRGVLRALAEDLELPLALRHFGVDALEVDPRIETDVDVLFHDLTRDRAHVLVAHARVVRTLRSRKATGRETQRRAVLVEKILLLETKPRVRIIR